MPHVGAGHLIKSQTRERERSCKIPVSIFSLDLCQVQPPNFFSTKKVRCGTSHSLTMTKLWKWLIVTTILAEFCSFRWDLTHTYNWLIFFNRLWLLKNLFWVGPVYLVIFFPVGRDQFHTRTFWGGTSQKNSLYKSSLTVNSLFSHDWPLACLQLVQHLRKRNSTVTEVL